MGKFNSLQPPKTLKVKMREVHRREGTVSKVSETYFSKITCCDDTVVTNLHVQQACLSVYENNPRKVRSRSDCKSDCCKSNAAVRYVYAHVHTSAAT